MRYNEDVSKGQQEEKRTYNFYEGGFYGIKVCTSVQPMR